MQKILGAVLIFTVVAGLSSSAFAADGSFGNVTVTNKLEVGTSFGTPPVGNSYEFTVQPPSGNLDAKFKSTNATTAFDLDGSGTLESKFQFRRSGGGKWRLKHLYTDDSMRFYDDVNDFDAMTLKLGGNVGINTSTPTEKLHVNGNVRVENELSANTVQIRGADLAESYKVNAATPVEPGMVVSIDPTNTAEMTLSGTPYDRKVAGIIANAGTEHTGLLLGGKKTASEGFHPVALTGRVWCWVDATLGAVSPGDMLTTSTTPGHAMKVADFSQAQDATIGKAMSELKSGKGLVLVLVNLH